MGIYPLPRAMLFRLDAETAHDLTLRAIATAGALAPVRATLAATFSAPDTEPVEVFGIRFPNRVGLAAGFDKDGDAWRGLAALGFGHIEVGTITPEAQPGNPKPRIFRLVEQRSVINRMGFPGRGAEYVAERLQGRRPKNLVLGVNIGKQKTTPIEQAVHDYTELIEVFAPLADYLAVNISSPNTPELRRLQERDYLEDLLRRLVSRRDTVAERIDRRVPLLVKLAPDLSDEQLFTAVDVIAEAGLDGIIATNTTVSREELDHPLAGEEGGLSGAALTEMSTRIVRLIHEHTGGEVPIVAVGGVMGPEDARAKLDAGASLVQIYSGLIYEGPGLVKRILKGL